MSMQSLRPEKEAKVSKRAATTGARETQGRIRAMSSAKAQSMAEAGRDAARARKKGATARTNRAALAGQPWRTPLETVNAERVWPPKL